MNTQSPPPRPALSAVASSGAVLSTATPSRPSETIPAALRPVPPLETAPEPPLRVLRCESTADFLAALPAIAGFTDENSLFVVLFRGKRSSDAIRFDLPEQRDRGSSVRLLDALVQILRSTGTGEQAPAAVITTNQSFAECGGVPLARFARQLQRRMRTEGWRLRELAVVASDGWCGLLGDDAGVARPLSEISRSPIAASSREQGQPARSLDDLARLPLADVARTQRIESHLSELAARDRARGEQSSQAAQAGDSAQLRMRGAARVAGACFEAAVAEGSGATDARLVAKLIAAAQTPECWLAIALTSLTRAEFVAGLANDCEAQFQQCPIDIDSGPEPGPRKGWSIRRLLFSLSHDQPDARKLRAAIASLSDAAAHAPLLQRPALLSLQAWAWWMLGMPSVSLRLLRQSLAIDSEHGLTLMVQRLGEAPPACSLSRVRERFAA